VKSRQIGLGVALVILVASALGLFITDGARAALSPTVSAIVCGVILYRLVRHPPPPTRWNKRRVILSVAVLVPATVAVVVTLAWVVLVVPDWPIRLLALAGMASVPAIIFWGVRIAHHEDQVARGTAQGPPSE
jgi:peptidoglycan biosynthesis protein MviN/MurJ (putative lipid II flippase)